MPKSKQIPVDFKSKFNWLIDNHKKPNGDRWSDKEIADATGSTRGYIYRLKNDPTVSNPTMEMLKRLAKFFGVGLQFFEDDFDPTDVSAVYATSIGAELKMRAGGLDKLSIEDQETILRIIDSTIKASQMRKKS